MNRRDPKSTSLAKSPFFVLNDEDVGRLEIAVNHAQAMHGLLGRRRSATEAHGPRDLVIALQTLRERRAFHKLHHQEQRAGLGDVDIDNRAGDVGSVRRARICASRANWVDALFLRLGRITLAAR